MRFWEILFSILLLVCIPYRITRHPNYDVVTVHIAIMPWAAAMTIGNIIFTNIKPSRWNEEEPIFVHELFHVAQWHQHGFMFIPKYVMSSLKAFFSGKRAYLDNEFEIQAYKGEYKYRQSIGRSYIDKYKDR